MALSGAAMVRWCGGVMTGVVLVLAVSQAHAGGEVIVDNRSARTVKAAAPGGGGVFAVGSGPVRVMVESDEAVGVMVQLWWVDKPLETCRVFTPWGRTIVVTGDTVIRCLSHD